MTVLCEPRVPKHRAMIDAALLMLNLLVSVAFWFEDGSSEGCSGVGPGFDGCVGRAASLR